MDQALEAMELDLPSQRSDLLLGKEVEITQIDQQSTVQGLAAMEGLDRTIKEVLAWAKLQDLLVVEIERTMAQAQDSIQAVSQHLIRTRDRASKVDTVAGMEVAISMIHQDLARTITTQTQRKLMLQHTKWEPDMK